MERSRPAILIVDDEPSILKMMGICFEAVDYDVKTFAKPYEALDAARDGFFELAFVDVKMTPIDGLQVLAKLKRLTPATTVVMMTAHGSIDMAVDAMNQGAYFFLQKPFECRELQVFAQKALEHHRLNAEVTRLRRELSGRSGPIITHNAAMGELIALARQVADSQISILIEGESGTGKELFAQMIHDASPRAGRPYVRVNCAALPENLLESELFGHVKGAFTGALRDRKGRFEAADGGTIFLDEIGEMPTSLQAKLLRVLQNREFERLGESTSRKLDIRVMAATNKNLDEAMKERVFREDLFYRLSGIRLHIPPLRERPDDIPLLVQHFVNKFAGDAPPEISADALRLLRAYSWPGNVREMENVMERAVLLARGGPVLPGHLPSEVREVREDGEAALSLEEVERRHIQRVLAHAEDYEEAARILGIDPATLWRKRKRYGL